MKKMKNFERKYINILYIDIYNIITALEKYISLHCSVETCHMLNFLPRWCDLCSQPFCDDHCDPDIHDCHMKDLLIKNSKRAIVCEHCNEPFNANLGHICVQKSKSKRFCAVSTCRVKNNDPIAIAAKVTCKHCGVSLCIDHRFAKHGDCHRFEG